MTDFHDILTHDAVVADVVAASKRHLFQQLAAVAERAYGLDPELVAERLGEREKLGSTGFGGGVAIPHGKVESLDRVVGVFARLARPLEFAAVDDMPVDLVFVLLSPPDAGAAHLKALARVSRMLRNREFAAKLRGAGSRDAMFALLSGVETRDAA